MGRDRARPVVSWVPRALERVPRPKGAGSRKRLAAGPTGPTARGNRAAAPRVARAHQPGRRIQGARRREGVERAQSRTRVAAVVRRRHRARERRAVRAGHVHVPPLVPLGRRENLTCRTSPGGPSLRGRPTPRTAPPSRAPPSRRSRLRERRPLPPRGGEGGGGAAGAAAGLGPVPPRPHPKDRIPRSLPTGRQRRPAPSNSPRERSPARSTMPNRRRAPPRAGGGAAGGAGEGLGGRRSSMPSPSCPQTSPNRMRDPEEPARPSLRPRRRPNHRAMPLPAGAVAGLAASRPPPQSRQERRLVPCGPNPSRQPSRSRPGVRGVGSPNWRGTRRVPPGSAGPERPRAVAASPSPSHRRSRTR